MPRHIIGAALDPWTRRFPWLQNLLWHGEAGFLRLLLHLCRGLPPERASAVGGALGSRLGPRLAKHRHVLDNYRRAFPAWDEETVQRTARGMWENFGRVIAEIAFLDRFCGRLRHRIEIVDAGGLELVRGRRSCAILVGAHLGNWELTQMAPAELGFEMTALYSAQKNPYIEAILQRQRSLLPCHFLEVEEAPRRLVREIRAGRSIGLLMDQRDDNGELVPFFGMPAATTIAPARLALRFGLPLIPVRIERVEGISFRFTLHSPVSPRRPDLRPREAALDMTAQLNLLFEEWIRARPEQWLCVKRRWPRKRSPMEPSRFELDVAARP